MPYLKLDDALVAMIRENQKILTDVWGVADLWDADIDWDHPMCMEEVVLGDDKLTMIGVAKYADASHAIGFIAGCAAAFNVTPLELLDVIGTIPVNPPPYPSEDYIEITERKPARPRRKATLKPSQRRQVIRKVR